MNYFFVPRNLSFLKFNREILNATILRNFNKFTARATALTLNWYSVIMSLSIWKIFIRPFEFNSFEHKLDYSFKAASSECSSFIVLISNFVRSILIERIVQWAAYNSTCWLWSRGMKMISIRVKVTILIVLFIAATIINPTKAECCQNAIALIPNCFSAYGCFEYICADGTPMGRKDNFCGVGKCNIFGCACEGGCRQNSKGNDEEEARRLYRMLFKKDRK